MLANSTHIPVEQVKPAGQMPVGQKKGLAFTYTSAAPLKSLSLKFEAREMKPIAFPSPLTDGGTSRVPLSASSP